MRLAISIQGRLPASDISETTGNFHPWTSSRVRHPEDDCQFPSLDGKCLAGGASERARCPRQRSAERYDRRGHAWSPGPRSSAAAFVGGAFVEVAFVGVAFWPGFFVDVAVLAAVGFLAAIGFLAAVAFVAAVFLAPAFFAGVSADPAVDPAVEAAALFAARFDVLTWASVGSFGAVDGVCCGPARFAPGTRVALVPNSTARLARLRIAARRCPVVRRAS